MTAATAARATRSTPRTPLARSSPARAPRRRRRADGTSEMIRQIKIARDTAVKARTQAIITLKALIVTCPGRAAPELEPLTKAALRDRCASLRPGPVTTPLAAAKHALRSLARRWQHLDAEIKAHDEAARPAHRQPRPRLRDAFGIGADVAAEMLILAGDNRERIRSEAAFAKLCGAARSRVLRQHPAPPPQLRRPPSSQQRPLPRRHRPHAIPPTNDRLRRPPHRRRQDQTRDHPLPQTLPRPRDLPQSHHTNHRDAPAPHRK